MSAARQSDPDTSDGSIVGGCISSVLINGLPAAVVGSVSSPHSPWGSPHPPHDAATVVSGSSTVIVGGLALARAGDPLSCGHAIASGSANVIAG
ncbi:COG4104 Uncharacterized conserved protein [uncultured Caudovirales phage]|uniref:COG4104 Uncharacterized conserved protein n=1 Tax=uncultured Caudovirales phage TaxID=2100421 RepID=A0A6J5L9L7_9CAUD|nr:COG4104 Uncharacterized conserved protein [uncultured Caudovirales phage]